MAQSSFETLHVYQLTERLASEVWNCVLQWSIFAWDTVGKQWVRAADSIGANLAEGCGRGSYADNKRHIHIARGSLNETICWLKRVEKRGLITLVQAESLLAITNELGPRLNGYLRYIVQQINGKPSGDQKPKG